MLPMQTVSAADADALCCRCAVHADDSAGDARFLLPMQTLYAADALPMLVNSAADDGH